MPIRSWQIWNEPNLAYYWKQPFASSYVSFLKVAHAAVKKAVPGARVVLGALTQVAATALMLAAMNDRSFVVVYAYIKTEPVQAALFGLIFLGDIVTPGMAAAILIATSGVVTMALKDFLGIDRAGK